MSNFNLDEITLQSVADIRVVNSNFEKIEEGSVPTNHADATTKYGESTAILYGHAKAGAVIPSPPGTASVGTDNGRYARADHVHQQTAPGYNHIINGDFRIWQRGESFAAIYDSKYTADRWELRINVASNFTVTRADLGIGVRSNSTYSDRSRITQYMENYGGGVSPLSGIPLTVSFEAVSSRANKKISVAIFGTSVSTPFKTKEITIGTSHTRYTATFAATDFGNIPYVAVGFALSGETGYLGLTENVTLAAAETNYLFNVKLEIGDTATPFVPRIEAEELALCQRYFERIGRGTSSVLSSVVTLPSGINRFLSNIWYTKKRVLPTIILSGVSQYRFYSRTMTTWSQNGTALSNIIYEAVEHNVAILSVTLLNALTADTFGWLQRSDDATSAWIDIDAEI